LKVIHIAGRLLVLYTATLEDFKDFHKKFYIPNNAVLVVAGDFEKPSKRMDRKILGPIEKGEVLKKQTFIEKPITQTIKATYQDPNIQIPMVVASTEHRQ
jgi:predicted Zn-dependent peptidase